MKRWIIILIVLSLLLCSVSCFFPEEQDRMSMFIISALMLSVAVYVLLPVYLWKNHRGWFWTLLVLANILGGISRLMGN